MGWFLLFKQRAIKHVNRVRCFGASEQIDGDFLTGAGNQIHGFPAEFAVPWVQNRLGKNPVETCNADPGEGILPSLFQNDDGAHRMALVAVVGGGAGNRQPVSEPASLLNSDGSFVGVTAFLDYPHLAIIEAIKESVNGTARLTGTGVGEIALLFIPVSFVVFAEHIADHKNMSSIIERDLLKDPGLHRTLIGDGFGTTVGTILGCCPNTTYGESIGCVAITKNASIYTIIGAACIAIVVAFFSPFIAFIETIPACVLGGVCIALYGFIAVSGLKMLQNVDLGESKNLFVVSSILVTGIGGLALQFGLATRGSAIITITNIATALIVGIVTNLIL